MSPTKTLCITNDSWNNLLSENFRVSQDFCWILHPSVKQVRNVRKFIERTPFGQNSKLNLDPDSVVEVSDVTRKRAFVLTLSLYRVEPSG